jgi:hypothetical protein
MKPQRYEIHTLVDITNTQDNNPKGNSVSYRQMQNLNTILQVLGIRAQPLHPQVVKNSTTEYFSNQDSWTLSFSCDITDAWSNGDNKTYFIQSDIHNTPVFTDLDETATLLPACFVTTGDNINTYIMFLD